MYKYSIFCLAILSLVACKSKQNDYDASGVFEATETIIAAETSGRIISMPITEGQILKAKEIAAHIDCNQLELQRDQATASKTALALKSVEAGPQIDILKEQQASQEKQLAVQKEQGVVLERERKRFNELVSAQAAPAKQLADIEGQISVLQKQMDATKSQIAITAQQMKSTIEQIRLQNRAIGSENQPIQARVAQIDDQITKCSVINPSAGTVLVKYAEENEFASPGKALYKIGALDTMILRAYLTGDQLGNVKIGQDVRVFFDAGADATREMSGKLIWVADKAEFTPKTIQTKDERANLVYAIKLRVPNDGSLKIGMYGEVKF